MAIFSAQENQTNEVNDLHFLSASQQLLLQQVA
jgi:hypothetical protein